MTPGTADRHVQKETSGPGGWRDPNQGQVQGNSQLMFTENAEEAPYAPYADHTPHAPNIPHTPLLATRAPVLLKNLSRNRVTLTMTKLTVS